MYKRQTNNSIDFPARYILGMSYAFEHVRLILAHEMTDGQGMDTRTTRVGFHAAPWKGAQLTTTLNQSGHVASQPSQFGQYGLAQSIEATQQWRFDLSVDSRRAFNAVKLPIAQLNIPLPSEDFLALSAGTRYRSDLVSWTFRVENRDSANTKRSGITTGFLRHAQRGVAFMLSAQAFQTKGLVSENRAANMAMSWAYRPLGHHFSMLEKLGFRYDAVANGAGIAGSHPFGNNGLNIAGNGVSKRVINNIVLNRVSRPWTTKDREGNLFEQQRDQWSLYYGSKYVLDQIEGIEYSGYTDLTGFLWRHDLTRRVDIGIRLNMLHAWAANNYDYSWGPMIGVSPFENGWVTFGYNMEGFTDADFSEAGYTATGFYLKLRIKFDQNTRMFGKG